MKNIFSQIKTSYLAQPDSVTCQATCIAMALNLDESAINDIRVDLVSRGPAGDPYNMGTFLKNATGGRYKFEVNANLNDIKNYLDGGEFLITHGWFSNSGHVICLDGYQADTKNMSYKVDVRDPYGEFDIKTWNYKPSVLKYNGFYSSYLLYSTCVKGQSYRDSQRIYKKGELDSSLKGAWVHRILN